jgi:hypothetical protein
MSSRPATSDESWTPGAGEKTNVLAHEKQKMMMVRVGAPAMTSSWAWGFLRKHYRKNHEGHTE